MVDSYLNTEILLDKSARELLKKYGKGKHIPGSGSAAAFAAMLGGRLIQTVIDICNRDDKQTKFKDVLPILLKQQKKIEETIIPRLESLHELDSKQFNEVISARLRCNNCQQNPSQRRRACDEEVDKLKKSTETPLEIAQLSAELCGFGHYVFNHGFQAARGDSVLAHNLAIAALSGCISIIDLNLLRIPHCSWTIGIRKQLDGLQLTLEKEHKRVRENQEKLANESLQRKNLSLQLQNFINSIKCDEYTKNTELEQYASDLLNMLWKNKKSVWKRRNINRVSMLNPRKILQALDYNYAEIHSLGVHEFSDGLNSIAGIISQTDRYVQISEEFPKEVRKFTAAHEIGHAVAFPFFRQSLNKHILF